MVKSRGACEDGELVLMHVLYILYFVFHYVRVLENRRIPRVLSTVGLSWY